MWGRFRRWPRARPLLIAVGFIALAGWLYFRSVNDQRVRLAVFSEPAVMFGAGPGENLGVVSDGQSLLIKQPADASHSEFIGQVRLLGIDRPKTAVREAAVRFLQEKSAAGKVWIDLDKRRVDRDGRFLAYVYVGNQHLSEELVAAGLARVHTYPGDSMTVNRKLLNAQDMAKREQRGIWSAEVASFKGQVPSKE